MLKWIFPQLCFLPACLMPAERERASEKPGALLTWVMMSLVWSLDLSLCVVGMFAVCGDNLISIYGCGAITLLNQVCQKGKAQIYHRLMLTHKFTKINRDINTPAGADPHLHIHQIKALLSHYAQDVPSYKISWNIYLLSFEASVDWYYKKREFLLTFSSLEIALVFVAVWRNHKKPFLTEATSSGYSKKNAQV